MNLLMFLRKDREKDETDMLDDSDCSETWPLPDWPELAKERETREKKIRHLKRLRKRIERERRKQERLLNSKSTLQDGSSIVSLDEDEEDLPDDMNERGQWNNSCEFLMSIISMSVGMGNFYRFPFVAYQNGGGAFLLPYLLVLTFIGRPIYLLELAVGQFCSYGQVKIWDMAPLFRGIGYGSALASFIVVTYYSSVMGTTFYYLFQSFRNPLPWTVCDPAWAGQEICENAQKIMKANKSITLREIVNLPQEYFERAVVQDVDSIETGIGYPLGWQTLCLFISWLTIYLIIAKGVESSGKAAYFTTIYPFAVIIILLITASTQQGSGAGMLYFLTPQWERIADVNVWFAAVGQCFFSLSAGFGPIMNYASFNPFRHNIYRDALVVSIMDTVASFTAGLTVFATLGSIAHTLDKPISEVISVSPGLVFIAFSDAISKFAYVPQLLAVLFFTMLLTLAIGSAVAWQIASIYVVCDMYPQLPKFWFTLAACILGFLASLLYVTPGGQFMVQLMDNFGGNVNIYILTGLECVGITWVYGLRNITKDIEFMLNRKVSLYWKICWVGIIPFMLTFVMIYSLVAGERLTYNGRPFPDVAIICGWLITLTTVMAVPVGAVITLMRFEGTFKQRLMASLKPMESFGPRSASDREKWKLFRSGILVIGKNGQESYKLPDGETRLHNSLPDWLIVLEDGRVVPKFGELEQKNGNLGTPSMNNNSNPPSLLSLVDLEEKSSMLVTPQRKKGQKSCTGFLNLKKFFKF